MSRAGCEHSVGALVIGELDERNGEHPAAPSHPGGVIDAQGGAEDVPRFFRQEVPRDDQVAGRIAHAETPEVDDGCAASNPRTGDASVVDFVDVHFAGEAIISWR
jgi:hypothetical protein